MKDYDVNFNNKTILLQGEWYNVKELGEKIKYNINKGNYKIKHLSEALEILQEVLESAKEIKVLIPGETYERIEGISKKYNKTIDIIVRDAINEFLKNFNTDTKPQAQQESSSIEIDIEPEIKPKPVSKPKPEVKPKPQIIEKTVKSKPEIIENKSIKPDKEIKKQPSIIVDQDDDDWFKN